MKLIGLAAEVAAVGAVVQQVVSDGPSGQTVVIGLLAVVIGLVASTWRKVAGVEVKMATFETRLDAVATREWTHNQMETMRRELE